MGSPSARGHQAQFKLFKNGGDLKVVNVKSVDIQQEVTFIKSHYVGNKYPNGDQSIDGYSGTVELEVGSADIDEFIDGLVNDNLNGVGVADYSFTTTTNFSDGSVKSYVYFDTQWKLGQRIPGANEKMTQRLEFQAMGRQAL